MVSDELKDLYECPDGCLNMDKECMVCVEGDSFKPLIKIDTMLIKRGSVDNPSYAIPIDKKLIKDGTIDVSKALKGGFRQ